MHSKTWFDAYEEAYDRLTGSDCPASLVGEAAASLANATLLGRLLDRADDAKDRAKEGR